MKTVFFDVDTQLDFLYPAGALAVPGAEEIVKPLTKLTRFAAANDVKIVSTTDAHQENDPEFRKWRSHCVIGTAGQHKAAGTLLNAPLILSSASKALDGIRSRVENAEQIIVQKQTLDCFTNPNLRPLLDLIRAREYVVYGVVSEYCVRYAVFGLLETGARVRLVQDAIKSLSSENERQMIDRLLAQGGELTTVAQVTA
ncbi:MAG: cysteine hydrolase [Acidobacteriaceae bacterium]|nr:cysteine hydrolase [Acidobacteriaceae bacterium]